MTHKSIETRSWDAAEHLETEEDMAAYRDAALEDGDPAVIMAAQATSPAPKAYHT